MTANSHDIVPAHLAVQAMRDNGYKNAAYALAELMDNSIQADATQVELLCGEKKSDDDDRDYFNSLSAFYCSVWSLRIPLAARSKSLS